jgi:FtsP/CotA-like multicopper oxidase with cupredoxin domain
MNLSTLMEGDPTMNRQTGRRRALVIAASSLLLASLAAWTAGSVVAVGSQSGIVCTTGASGSPTFTLTAKSGYVAMPDGNTIFMWGYAQGNGGFQLPGPTLCVNQGDMVTIVLNNKLSEPVSIVLPGVDDVMANGVPSQPVFSGTTLISLAPSAPAANGSMTYSFTANRPGTYLYESGTDPEKQVEMGLYGSLIVRPPASSCPTGKSCAYDSNSVYNANTESVMLLSEIDPFLHQAVERRNKPYDVTAYRPRYWLINGRAFPDTIAPNGAAWLPAQPYSSLVHLHPKDTSNPDPALVRYLNVGVLNHPFHPHGNHGRVVGRDGSPLVGPAAQDISYEKFTVTVGSGQTWDTLYNWTDVELWNPNTNPIPGPGVPQPQNLTFKDSATWYSGSPYLGYQDDLPAGVTSYNQCGEFYHVWHSHALDEAANFDAGFGGMLTLERIDPPLPNTCP